ncbi:transposase [Microcoleus sp. N3A4]|uniref:transposase n=1 Tax=Microcoleus sp. N3A4 TaxID=3055379 RepID=UPI002FD715C5
MQTLTYEYKLDPTPDRSKAFEQWLMICHKAYNFALRERKDWVNSRRCSVNACSLKQEYILPANAPKPTFYSQCKSLAAAKETNPNLKIPHTHIMQQVLRTLEASFVAMWERGRGFPRFKKRMRSLLYAQLNKMPVKADRVNLPKIGWVKMRLSRPFPFGCELKQVRVVKWASGFYDATLAFQTFVEVPQPTPSAGGVGIDLGLLHFLAKSESELVARPRFLVDGQRKLKSLQRQLKPKTRGYRESQRLQPRIARHHESISNARKDFHFKTAHHLCDSALMIFAEDLNLKAMSAGMLCKHTLDAGFRQFLSILAHVWFMPEVYFAKVEANITSQSCPNCQTHTGKIELSEPVRKCQTCGYQ